MNKSLTPLIIMFALVILATIIIVNTQSKDDEKVVDYDQEALVPDMELSPFLELRRRERRRRMRLEREKAGKMEDSDKVLSKARDHLSRGKADLAEDKLRTLLIFEPQNRPALSLLGAIFYSSGRYREAEMVFSRQILLDPKDSAAHSKLILSLEKQNKYEEALETARNGLSFDDTDPGFLMDMARMNAAANNQDDAIKYLELAHKTFGGDLLPLMLDTIFDGLRTNIRFMTLLRKVNQDMSKKHAEENFEKKISESESVDSMSNSPEDTLKE